jgi:predicted membrane protein
MNTISRTIVGGVLFLFGLFFTFTDFFNLLTFTFGILIIFLGGYIFLNKKEDEIEQIKEENILKGGKKK